MNAWFDNLHGRARTRALEMICPLTVIKCQRSDFTGRVNEIPYVAYEVPLHGVMVRTLACGLTFKKRPETHVPAPWWADPNTRPL